jgi:membrane-bound ClpP family serine protease
MKKQESSGLKVWLIVLIALLDDIAVLALVFILLWIFDVKIPLSAVIVIVLVAGTLIFIVHRALVPALRRRKATGSEAMVGLTGEVTEPLTPRGTIKVKGEYWQARSSEGNIEAGVDVEITGIDRLVLDVRRKTP